MKKKFKLKFQTAYMEKVYKVEEFAQTVQKATLALRKFRKKHPFDAIAFRGHSGAALAYPLSLRLKVPLICIRKGTSHTDMKLEGVANARTYLIVDDFIDKGNTIKKIKQEVGRNRYWNQNKPELVGILLYASPKCTCGKCEVDEAHLGIPIIRL
jgi:adenine/guanine phosphoribosyltransferase-like PRPP-binding protein